MCLHTKPTQYASPPPPLMHAHTHTHINVHAITTPPPPYALHPYAHTQMCMHANTHQHVHSLPHPPPPPPTKPHPHVSCLPSAHLPPFAHTHTHTHKHAYTQNPPTSTFNPPTPPNPFHTRAHRGKKSALKECNTKDVDQKTDLSLAVWKLGARHGWPFVGPRSQDVHLVLILHTDTHTHTWVPKSPPPPPPPPPHHTQPRQTVTSGSLTAFRLHSSCEGFYQLLLTIQAVNWGRPQL